MHPTTKRSIRSILHVGCAAALLLLALVSCKSPVGHGRDRERADYTFSFIVSGASSKPGRLILPTATHLTVSLRKSGASSDLQFRTEPITATTVPVSFADLETGRYTVSASAYADPAIPLFAQTAEIELTPETESVVLNLVPCDAESVAAESADAVEIPALVAGAAKTWRLAAGSRVLAARSLFLRDLNSDALVFVQAEDGTLIASGSPNRLSLAGLDPDEAHFLTVYAGASAQSAARAFPGPVMLPVPAGSFQRDVTATNISSVSAFSLARLETTRELYAAVMGADPSVVGYSSGLTDPVNNVSWYQAIAFCNKLSLLEGLTPVYSVTGVDFATLNHAAIPSASDSDWNTATIDQNANGYRLPTDMEWMWAAMGATSGAGYAGGVNTVGYTRYFAGSDGTNSGDDYAWHVDNSGSVTHPAGTKMPNELGFHDMTGNVREICRDWYVATVPSGSLDNYAGPSTNASVLRTWLGTPCDVNLSSTQLTVHNPYSAYAPNQEAGFRVAWGSVALPTYTITFNANGATGGTVPPPAAAEISSSLVFPANVGNLYRINPNGDGISYGFRGWNTDYVATTALSSYEVTGNATLYAVWTPLALRDVGPAGGLIFYDKGTYDNSPNGTGPSWRYLEAAPHDQSAGVAWGLEDAFDQYRYDMGTGLDNTSSIASRYPGGSYAANICDALVLNGFDDWYLPSYFELSQNSPALTGGMWEKLYYDRPNTTFVNYGNFTEGGRYWTSSETNAASAIYQSFEAGASSSTGAGKGTLYRVRAARRF